MTIGSVQACKTSTTPGGAIDLEHIMNELLELYNVQP